MFKRWFSSKKREEISQPHFRDLRSQQNQDLSGSKQQRLHKDLQEIAKLKKTMQLPKKFAQSVIELEIQCERPDATKEHVKKLMDLYTVNN